MTEKRGVRMICNLEKTIVDLVYAEALRQDISGSSYVRDLILRDLMAKQLISEAVMERLI